MSDGVKIEHDGKNYWKAKDVTGRIVGTVRGEGDAGGPYTCSAGEHRIKLNDRADALLWLSLRTDTKEGRDAFFRG